MMMLRIKNAAKLAVRIIRIINYIHKTNIWLMKLGLFEVWKRRLNIKDASGSMLAIELKTLS